MSEAPKVTAEEREKIECMVERLAKGNCCDDDTAWRALSCVRCKEFTAIDLCHSIAREERAKLLQRVLDQQDSLLPVHCSDQLPKEEYDALKQWRALDAENREGFCPVGYGLWEECSDCRKIFTEITCQSMPDCEDDGPCATYGDEKVCAVADIILAKGPFVEYPIWSKTTGERYVVQREDATKIYVNHPTLQYYYKGNVEDTWTKTPPAPKEEPFVQYVAVWDACMGKELQYVTGHRDNCAVTTCKVGGVNQLFDLAKIDRIATTPEECRDMLNKVLGEKSTVEEIKVWITRNQYRPNSHTPKTVQAGRLLDFIAELEGKAK